MVLPRIVPWENPWFSHGFPMVFPGFPWFSLVFPWFSHGFPWFSMVFVAVVWGEPQFPGDDVLPLHLAAGKGHLPLLPLLLASTKALEKGDADGATALWRAAQKGQLDAAAWWMRMMQCGTPPVIS